MDQNIKYDAFISHASQDKPVAMELCKYLESDALGMKLKCWIAPRDVTGLYARSIIDGIKSSQVMVLVYSDYANESPHVESEIDNAFNEGKIIIPFRLEDKQMSDVLNYYLRKNHYIDGFPDATAAFELLKNQIINNLPEKRQNRDLDNALETIASLKGINVEKLRTVFGNVLKDDIDKTEDSIDDQAPNDKADMTIDTENAAMGGRYDILQNAKGELLLIIKFIDSEPDNPRIVYDGGETALLYRNRESAILLESISLKARVPLTQAESILVAEVQDDDVAREYKVPIRIIRKLDFFD